MFAIFFCQLYFEGNQYIIRKRTIVINHRTMSRDELQAHRIAQLHGDAAARFVPQTDPEPPSPCQSSRTGRRAIL